MHQPQNHLLSVEHRSFISRVIQQAERALLCCHMPGNRIKPFPSLRGIQASSIRLPVLNFIPLLPFAAGPLTSSFTPKDLCPTGKPVGAICKTSMKSVRQSPGPAKGNKNFTTASCGAAISLFCSSKPCCFSARAGLLFSLEPLFSMQMENRAAEGLPS